jgi:hypothetical protein
MAFFDFMNEPVMGSTAVKPEPIAEGMEFGAGGGFTTPNSGMTWGQLLGVIAKLSNSQSGQMLGQGLEASYGAAGSGVLRQPGSTAMGQQTGQPMYAPKPELNAIGPTQAYYQPTDKPADSTGLILGMLGGGMGGMKA